MGSSAVNAYYPPISEHRQYTRFSTKLLINLVPTRRFELRTY